MLSCIDLLFDHWLRTRPEFGLMFFAVVAFAAINLLLPLVVGIRPRFAAPAAALLSIGERRSAGSAHGTERPGIRLRLTAAAVVLLAVAVGLPGLIPPVPLRMEEATFASGIDSETLALADTLPIRGRFGGGVGGSLFVLVEVFAPSALPAHVRLEWRRDGELFRLSREVGIIAHAAGLPGLGRLSRPVRLDPPGTVPRRAPDQRAARVRRRNADGRRHPVRR